MTWIKIVENKMTIFRRKRIEAGLSCKDAARMLFVSRDTLRKWETNDLDNPIRKIQKISKIYGCDPIEFFLAEKEQIC
jgi:predicted transcriptional regulator